MNGLALALQPAQLFYVIALLCGICIGLPLFSPAASFASLFMHIIAVSIAQLQRHSRFFYALFFYLGYITTGSLWLIYPLVDIWGLPWVISLLLLLSLFFLISATYALAWWLCCLLALRLNISWLIILPPWIIFWEQYIVTPYLLAVPWLNPAFNLQYLTPLSSLVTLLGLHGSRCFWWSIVSYSSLFLTTHSPRTRSIIIAYLLY